VTFGIGYILRSFRGVTIFITIGSVTVILYARRYMKYFYPYFRYFLLIWVIFGIMHT